MEGAGAPVVVALVCSTGGLDAVQCILEGLPATFLGALIVLRHHDPRAVDHLAPVLRRHTVLPVASARDGDTLLAGRVLVAPTRYHTLVSAGARIALILSGDRPPYRPSADLLLTSMALSLGPRAVAVVLSGYGNDGATGATAVHRFGGTVIVSNRATSQVFGMPSATIDRYEVVDHVTAVDHIAALLTTVIAARPDRGP